MTPSPSASCCQTKTRWPHRGVSPPPLLQLRSGFSLIELLVVIAIIVILAVLSFQAVGAMRARGESAKCMSNLRSMGVAIQLYANDHDGRYPGPVWYSASWEIQKWGGVCSHHPSSCSLSRPAGLVGNGVPKKIQGGCRHLSHAPETWQHPRPLCTPCRSCKIAFRRGGSRGLFRCTTPADRDSIANSR